MELNVIVPLPQEAIFHHPCLSVFCYAKGFGALTMCAISLNFEDSTGYTFPGGEWHCVLPGVNPADRYKLFEPDKGPLTFATVRQRVRWETSGEGMWCFIGGSHPS